MLFKLVGPETTSVEFTLLTLREDESGTCWVEELTDPRKEVLT